PLQAAGFNVSAKGIAENMTVNIGSARLIIETDSTLADIEKQAFAHFCSIYEAMLLNSEAGGRICFIILNIRTRDRGGIYRDKRSGAGPYNR
ncbi:MAG: hypothetical protein LBE16_09685, partial [Clostridiales Family XIII bacterium]|nr:hypothetical protein [Clostridiales Family XIII bacterium]